MVCCSPCFKESRHDWVPEQQIKGGREAPGTPPRLPKRAKPQSVRSLLGPLLQTRLLQTLQDS